LRREEVWRALMTLENFQLGFGGNQKELRNQQTKGEGIK
jgi:hypothetical protein